ncbi:MAG: outer membrane protein assembly factor BamC [Pontibacterium sp.]
MKKAVSLTILACALQAGCSVVENNPIYGESGIIRDRSQDYEKAKEGVALEVPPHLRARQTEQSLVIPEIGQVATQNQGEYKAPRPEFFYTDTSSEKVSLARAGDEKLIIVDAPVDEVWQKLGAFWQANGVEMAVSDVNSRTMETDWIQRKGEDIGFINGWLKRLTFQDIQGPTKDKLQVVVRPEAANKARTAIAMKHVRFAQDAVVDQVDWDNSARDVGYKADMMFEMLRYLSKATNKEDAPTLTKLNQPKQGRVLQGRDSKGNPVLKIEAPVDQAWSSVAAVMASEPFDLGTADKNAGMFYFSFTTSEKAEEKKMGFFEWLHSDREKLTFKSTALAEALGVSGKEGQAANVRYSAKDMNEEAQAAEAGMTPEEREQQALQKQKGFKIWFAGKVVYVFGDGTDETEGVYNKARNAYEFTGRYQLKLNRARGGVFLSVLTDQGLAAPAAIADEILWDLKESLSKN